MINLFFTLLSMASTAIYFIRNLLDQLGLTLIVDATIASVVVVLVVATLIRKISNPEKSLFNSLANVALIPVRYFGLGPYQNKRISVEGCLRAAMHMTKLTDMGNTTFFEVYNKLYNSTVFQSMKYSNLGFIGAQVDLTLVFASRLRKINYCKQHPEIKKVPMHQPIFILGLPRSGTTYLHRLLSLDPQFRGPKLWELMNPIPIAKLNDTIDNKIYCQQKRQEYVEKLLKRQNRLGETTMEFKHEINAILPEECLMVLREEFPFNLQHLPILYMNDFYTLFNSVNWTCILRYYQETLQLLSYQIGEIETPRSWILKCPFYLLLIKEIKELYPDAKLIWTHRHPLQAVPSLASFLESCHLTYYEKSSLDYALLGRSVVQVIQEWLQQASTDLKSTGLPCHHIQYTELTINPIETIKAIYQGYNWTFSSEYETILTEYITKNKEERQQIKDKKHNSTLHNYPCSKYSIHESDLRQGVYEDYVNTYHITS